MAGPVNKFLCIFLFVSMNELSAGSGDRCSNCEKKRSEPRAVAVVLTGIAQIAQAFALFFGNAVTKEDYNEAVCALIAGACTIAAQASKGHSQDSNPVDIYNLLTTPESIEAIKKIFSDALDREKQLQECQMYLEKQLGFQEVHVK